MKISNNIKKPEEKEDGTSHQDTSGKNKKAKGEYIPPVKWKVLRSTEE